MLVGVIGKPNTGKSTFFKAATLADAEIANYPFVTIKPNEGIGYVRVACPESFFKVKCSPKEGYCSQGQRFVPVRLMDVAGLVPGAHEGKGMGNQFLDDLRQADALVHVVDASGSTNEKGEPVEAGTHDPAEDIRFLESELDHWYLGIFERVWSRFARQVKQEQQDAAKAIAKQFSGLKVTERLVESLMRSQGLDLVNINDWSEAQLRGLVTGLRKATKPIIIAANKMDVPGARANLERLRNEFSAYMIVPCSAESELALRQAAKHGVIEYVPGSSGFKVLSDEISDRQRKALEFMQKYLDDAGSTGVQEVLNAAVFRLLKLIPVYPVASSRLTDKDGNVLPNCFLVPLGTTALEFAFMIHSDIGRAFVKAIDMRTKQVIGKEHALKEGDVIEIAT